jgi:hypothetical protein
MDRQNGYDRVTMSDENVWIRVISSLFLGGLRNPRSDGPLTPYRCAESFGLLPSDLSFVSGIFLIPNIMIMPI